MSNTVKYAGDAEVITQYTISPQYTISAWFYINGEECEITSDYYFHKPTEQDIKDWISYVVESYAAELDRMGPILEDEDLFDRFVADGGF